MEHYYFIQKGGTKQGPYKLTDLRAQTIYYDELIWRSDNDQWKKASEFNELEEVLIIKPPLTPFEKNAQEFDSHFVKKELPVAISIYAVMSILLSTASFTIATNEWSEVKNRYLMNQDEVGKYRQQIETQKINSDAENLKLLRERLNKLRQYVKPIQESPNILSYNRKAEPDSIYKYERLQNQIRELEVDSSYRRTLISFQKTGLLTDKVEPNYNIPKSITLSEDAHASGQPFLFRPFNAFLSKIYLSKEEQDSSGKLFLNLVLSSCIVLLLAFLAVTAIYYFIKRHVVLSENK